jgi:hypothetical protein
MKIKYYAIIGVWIALLGLAHCKSKIQNTKIAETKSISNDSLATYPYWIAMMDDPKVNYYQAIEAFEKYWESREQPTEKDGEAKDIFEKDKTKEEREKEEKRSVLYVYEYKQFLNWKDKNKDFVKPDGTIMTQQEILEQSLKARETK